MMLFQGESGLTSSCQFASPLTTNSVNFIINPFAALPAGYFRRPDISGGGNK